MIIIANLGDNMEMMFNRRSHIHNRVLREHILAVTKDSKL